MQKINILKKEKLLVKFLRFAIAVISSVLLPQVFHAIGVISGTGADLSDSALYEHLTDKSIAIKNGDKVYGIPYTVEGYGIIYNEEIMDKYFKLSNKKTDIKSVKEINSFDKLKQVVEDMQSKKQELGIKGVFASTSLKSGEDWRWQTHLLNVPLYKEFDENDIDLTGDDIKNIEFKYSDNY